MNDRLADLHIIGLHGSAGAGKSTTARQIAHYSDGETLVMATSFAAPLYESAAAALGITVDDLRKVKVSGEIVVLSEGREDHQISGRKYLEFYGTEAHRDVFGTDFWVDIWENRVRTLYESYGDTVRTMIVTVDDLRFPNEAKRIQELGGKIVRVMGSKDYGLDNTGHESRKGIATQSDYEIGIVHGDDDQNRDVVKAMLESLVGDCVV